LRTGLKQGREHRGRPELEIGRGSRGRGRTSKSDPLKERVVHWKKERVPGDQVTGEKREVETEERDGGNGSRVEGTLILGDRGDGKILGRTGA